MTIQLSQIVAKMNGGWEPDWSNGYEDKVCVFYCHTENSLRVDSWNTSNTSNLYFKTEEMAKFSMK